MHDDFNLSWSNNFNITVGYSIVGKCWANSWVFVDTMLSIQRQWLTLCPWAPNTFFNFGSNNPTRLPHVSRTHVLSGQGGQYHFHLMHSASYEQWLELLELLKNQIFNRSLYIKLKLSAQYIKGKAFAYMWRPFSIDAHSVKWSKLQSRALL